MTVDRFALRGWDGDAVDPVDLEERDKTAYTLRNGIVDLMLGAVKRGWRHPGPVWRAVKAAMAMAMARGGMRPWPYHLVYVAHACRIMDWLDQRPVAHLHAHFGTNPAEIAHLVKVMGGRAIVSRCMEMMSSIMRPVWPCRRNSEARLLWRRSAPIPAVS